MAKRRTISIEVVLNEAGVVKGIRGIDGSLKGLERTSDKTAKSGFNLGRAFEVGVGNVMASAVQAFGRAVRALVGQGAKLIGQSADIFETQSKLEAVFQSSTGKVQDFIEEYANLAGMSKVVAQEMVATTGAILEGAGFGADAAADMSIAVTRLAGDLTSFTNIPVEETLRAIQGALTGEREMLKRLGIVLLETDVQKRALNDTGKESARSLTQQEKATATLKLITEKAGVAIGDLERTQHSAANQMRQIQARLADLKDELAEELLPAITDVSTSFNEFLKDPKLKQAARSLGEAISDGLQTAFDVILKLIRFLKDYGNQIRDAVKITAILTVAIIAYRTAAITATIATRGLNLAIKANPFGALAALLTTIALSVAELAGLFDNFTDKFRDNTKVVADNIKGLKEWGEQGLKARLAMLELNRETLRMNLLFARTAGKPALLEQLQQDLSDTATKIFETRESLRLIAEEAPGTGGGGGGESPAVIQAQLEADALASIQEEAVRGEIELLNKEAADKQEIRDMQKDADADLAAFLVENDEFVTAGKKRNAAEQKVIDDNKAASARATSEATVRAAMAGVAGEEDAAKAVVKSVTQVIKAKLAEAIARTLGELPFPANIILGAIAAVALNAVFNKLLRSFGAQSSSFDAQSQTAGEGRGNFRHGGRNIRAGLALVGEGGPELVHLPSGSSVIPAPQTARMMSGINEIEVQVVGTISGEDIHLSNARTNLRLTRMGHA